MLIVDLLIALAHWAVSFLVGVSIWTLYGWYVRRLSQRKNQTWLI